VTGCDTGWNTPRTSQRSSGAQSTLLSLPQDEVTVRRHRRSGSLFAIQARPSRTRFHRLAGNDHRGRDGLAIEAPTLVVYGEDHSRPANMTAAPAIGWAWSSMQKTLGRRQYIVAGGPATTAGFLKMIARTGEAARLPFPIHPHMLRHSTGYKLANDGHDTRALQHYMGHKNIMHTVRYTEMAPDRFKDFWKD
jgi:hypothetical protein